MSNLEIQIKNIEKNIFLKEKKRKILEKEIKELKNVSDKIYDELIKQEEILFQKKLENVEWDLKINKLKKENFKTKKKMEQTNTLLHVDFYDFKNKKKETKEKMNKLKDIITVINNEHLKQKKECNILYQKHLQTLQKNKIKHNNNLQNFIKKKNVKILTLQKKIKTIETNAVSLYQEISILNEEVLYNINKIKYFLNQEIKLLLTKQLLTIDKSNLNSCLLIITNILDKEKQQNQIFNEKWKYMYNKIYKELLNQPENNSNNTNEMNIHLGTQTQEFLEL